MYMQPFSMEWIDEKFNIKWMYLPCFNFVDTAFLLCGVDCINITTMMLSIAAGVPRMPLTSAYIITTISTTKLKIALLVSKMKEKQLYKTTRFLTTIRHMLNTTSLKLDSK